MEKHISYFMKKVFDKLYILAFLLILSLPLILARRETGRISESENRTLADPPQLLTDNGKVNWEYAADFDSWINDNIRFRNIAAQMNATLQYTLFRKITKDNMREGRDNNLFYVGEVEVNGYQHLDLLQNDDLQAYTTSLQGIKNYLAKRNISFYYMQCYSKEHIYPEYYVDGVLQFGKISKAEQIVTSINEKTDISVIPVYENLIENMDSEMLYYKTVDVGHWNDAGAYIGYTSLMTTLAQDYPDITWLQPSDYNITAREEKANIYGFRYPYPETNDYYFIKAPTASEQEIDEVDSEHILLSRENSHYFVNDNPDKKLKILLLNDSYIRQSIKDDIAEGFHETLSIYWDNITNLEQVLEIYNPDIVVFESAESSLDSTVSLISSTHY